ncbi:MAG: AIR synthase-related protein [Solitalea-like symbiont of Acarus siro]
MIVDSTAISRIKRKDVINIDIKPGNVIVGLASSGQATYETSYNSGIGSNGLTSARHDIFNKTLAKNYPETFDNNTNPNFIYSGSKGLDDSLHIPKWGTVNIAKLLLSPTRTYQPVIKEILKNGLKDKIQGMIHCTGGGQSKILHFIKKGCIIKDNLFALPPIFRLITQEGKTPVKELYNVFNMGHRMEIYTDELSAKQIIKISQSFDIDAQIIGRVKI